MNKTLKTILDATWYFIMFLIIQFAVMAAVSFATAISHSEDIMEAVSAVLKGTSVSGGDTLIWTSALSSALTIVLYAWRKWSPYSRKYLLTRPWTPLVWVSLLALGTIIPSEWMVEQMNMEMPEPMVKMFEDIMSRPAGYLVIGILAPLAEEMVFRGAVLRTLLRLFPRSMHWLPIVLSALVFGLVHGNVPQFVHATLIGLLLGWLYYRTDSIVPGVVLHWVNNTVAYLMFVLMPWMHDGKLIDLFNGSSQTTLMAVLFSFCIIIPSIFQLSFRLRRA